MALGQALPEEVEPEEKVTNPTLHPLIKIWLGCQAWSTEGQRILPWEGGWLDWDLHESKGLLWLEELVAEIRGEIKKAQDLEEARLRATNKASDFVARLPQS